MSNTINTTKPTIIDVHHALWSVKRHGDNSPATLRAFAALLQGVMFEVTPVNELGGGGAVLSNKCVLRISLNWDVREARFFWLAPCTYVIDASVEAVAEYADAAKKEILERINEMLFDLEDGPLSYEGESEDLTAAVEQAEKAFYAAAEKFNILPAKGLTELLNSSSDLLMFRQAMPAVLAPRIQA